MSQAEIAAALDQIAALSAAAPPMDFQPARNRPVDLTDPPAQTAELILRVSVRDTSPEVWRRVVVCGDLTLDVLHEVIQRALGWQDHHLHRFWATADESPWRGPYFVTTQDVAEGEAGTPESDVRADQLLRETGDRLIYTYDFGDEWTHEILLESSRPLGEGAPLAACLEGAMAGPLEDSGGPPGYNQLVEAFLEDPSLGRLEDYVREWVPGGWDPTELDLERVNRELSVIGAAGQEVFAATAGAPPPESVGALLDIAPPDVLAEIAELCRIAVQAQQTLTDDNLAAIARPYRVLLELAGADGIQLTQAGWLKPATVAELVAALGVRTFGKARREMDVPPIAALRQGAVNLGLLRKYKGRLLRTRKAERLVTDRDVVAAVAAGLLRAKDGYLAAARGLFALLSVESGRCDLRLADDVAELLTRCGLRTGPTGVDRWAVLEMVRPTWHLLDSDSGTSLSPRHADPRAVALAVAALWPQRLTGSD